jgi:hypothetical protein
VELGGYSGNDSWWVRCMYSVSIEQIWNGKIFTREYGTGMYGMGAMMLDEIVTDVLSISTNVCSAIKNNFGV